MRRVLIILLLVLLVSTGVLSGCLTSSQEAKLNNQSPVEGKEMRRDELIQAATNQTNAYSYGSIHIVAYCEDRTICYVFTSQSGQTPAGISCVTDITGPLVVRKYCGALEGSHV